LASFFYMTIGIFGSLFGAKCNTPNANIVSGNILLDFDDDDPVVTLGRICLGITITFAIPLQVIPARDTLVRLIQEIVDHRSARRKKRQSNTNYSQNPQDLLEPLLEESSTENNGINISNSDEVFQRFLVMTQQQQHQQQMERNPLLRKVVGVTLLWSAASIAAHISSVALVWDFLGSSLVIIIGFILPSILYLRICCDEDASLLFWKSSFSCKRLLAFIMIVLYTPLMICCTINVIRMNFFLSG
jgi:hypothetical protein